MVLEAYSSILSFVFSSAILPLLLSPGLTCRDFMKKGSSDHLKPFIFVQGLIRSSLFIQFGLMARLNSIVRMHSLGIVLYVTYFTLYYKYCSKKKEALVSLMKGLIFVWSLLGYVNYNPNSLAATYFQLIVTVVHLTLLAQPLLNLKEIIRKKSTAGMPFPILCCAAVVSVSGLLYGISVHNQALIWQMAIGSILLGIQLSLFVIYPSKVETKKGKKKKN